MSRSLDGLYRLLVAKIRDYLAGLGKAWVKAGFHVEADEGYVSAYLQYQEREGGDIIDDKDWVDNDAFDWFREIRDLTPHPGGRRWTRARLTFRPDGRHEEEFEYPVPPPVAWVAYAPGEILRTISECVRRDLAHVPWTEAWVDCSSKLVPHVYYRTAGNDDPRLDVDDVNYLEKWLERLWQARQQSGEGPWAKACVKVFPDGRFEATFEPAPVTEPAPVIAEPPRALDELLGQIAGEVRDDAERFSQLLRENGKIVGSWREVRVSARWSDSYGHAEATTTITFDDGQMDDEFPADEEVEELFDEIYERLERGEDAGPLRAAGLAICPGPKPEFTLIVRNEPEAEEGE